MQPLPTSAKAAIDTREQVAAKANVSHDTIAKVKVIEAQATPEQKAQLVKGTATVNNVFTQIRKQEGLQKQREWESQPKEVLTGPFEVLLADPPWQYEHSVSQSREIENQYPTLSLEAICAIAPEIRKQFSADSVLFLWATSPKLLEALQVMEAWGYEYRTCVVWVKDQIGMGYYVRQKHELLLIGKRGNLPMPLPENRPESVIMAPRGAHSAKPVEAYELIERMYPGHSKLELFSREAREGWTAWGSELGNT